MYMEHIMTQIDIEKFKIQCKRCQYKWIPRKAEIVMCPKCRSPYWDRKKK